MIDSVKLNDKYKVFNNSSRYFVITGGRGSGKSFAVALILLLLTFEKGHKVLFTRFTMKSAHLSIIPEFLGKIEMLNLQEHFKISKDEIINIRTGSMIIFRGIKTSSGDQSANLKSLEGVTTWVLDEAEELTDEETFDKIDLSVRVKGIDNRVICLMNPSTKEHFIYRKFFEDKGIEAGSNTFKEDTTYIHTTYLDNIENLSKSYIAQLTKMRERRPEKYKHVVLGGWLDKAEGVIFSNWKLGDFEEYSTPVYGQDYGFSTDPTTLVKTSIDRTNKRIFVKEELYKPSLTTKQIVEINQTICGQSLVIGDSAEPRLITELQNEGINIEPTIKGQGSVLYGISLLLDYDLIIDPSSINLVKELNNYVWLEKKSQTPCDSFNHLIDALRYAVAYQLGDEYSGEYAVI